MATRPEFKAGQFAVKNRPVISVMCGAVFTAAAGVVYAGSDEPVFSEEVIHPSISAKSLANDNKDTPLLQGRMSIEEGCYEHDILGRDCSGAVGKLKAHAEKNGFFGTIDLDSEEHEGDFVKQSPIEELSAGYRLGAQDGSHIALKGGYGDIKHPITQQFEEGSSLGFYSREPLFTDKRNIELEGRNFINLEVQHCFTDAFCAKISATQATPSHNVPELYSRQSIEYLLNEAYGFNTRPLEDLLRSDLSVDLDSAKDRLEDTIKIDKDYYRDNWEDFLAQGRDINKDSIEDFLRGGLTIDEDAPEDALSLAKVAAQPIIDRYERAVAEFSPEEQNFFWFTGREKLLDFPGELGDLYEDFERDALESLSRNVRDGLVKGMSKIYFAALNDVDLQDLTHIDADPARAREKIDRLQGVLDTVDVDKIANSQVLDVLGINADRDKLSGELSSLQEFLASIDPAADLANLEQKVDLTELQSVLNQLGALDDAKIAQIIDEEIMPKVDAALSEASNKAAIKDTIEKYIQKQIDKAEANIRQDPETYYGMAREDYIPALKEMLQGYQDDSQHYNIELSYKTDTLDTRLGLIHWVIETREPEILYTETCSGIYLSADKVIAENHLLRGKGSGVYCKNLLGLSDNVEGGYATLWMGYAYKFQPAPNFETTLDANIGAHGNMVDGVYAAFEVGATTCYQKGGLAYCASLAYGRGVEADAVRLHNNAFGKFFPDGEDKYYNIQAVKAKFEMRF